MKRKLWLPGFLGMAAALALLHRYGRHSGATSTEHKQTLSGDAVIPDPDLVITNAITIHAAPETIWPWLVQLGYYRGGWFTDSTWRDWDYYPDKIMRFFVREEAERSGYAHRDAPSVNQIISEFQHLQVGDVVLDGPPGTAYFTVAAMAPDRHLVLYSNTHLRFLFPKSIRENAALGIGGEFTWGFFLERIDGTHTRLLLRTRGSIRPWWYRLAINATVPIANIFLARRMLKGIKLRSESSPGSA
jgi:hypothetical protein